MKYFQHEIILIPLSLLERDYEDKSIKSNDEIEFYEFANIIREGLENIQTRASDSTSAAAHLRLE